MKEMQKEQLDENMYLSGFIRLDIEEFTEPCVPRKITRLLVVDFLQTGDQQTISKEEENKGFRLLKSTKKSLFPLLNPVIVATKQ